MKQLPIKTLLAVVCALGLHTIKASDTQVVSFDKLVQQSIDIAVDLITVQPSNKNQYFIKDFLQKIKVNSYALPVTQKNTAKLIDTDNLKKAYQSHIEVKRHNRLLETISLSAVFGLMGFWTYYTGSHILRITQPHNILMEFTVSMFSTVFTGLSIGMIGSELKDYLVSTHKPEKIADEFVKSFDKDVQEAFKNKTAVL